MKATPPLRRPRGFACRIPFPFRFHRTMKQIADAKAHQVRLASSRNPSSPS